METQTCKNQSVMAVTDQVCYSWAENRKMSFAIAITNNVKPSIMALTS